MANDLFSSLKILVQQFQEGEKNASDLMKSLNTWAKEIGDLIKNKVEEEVESSVKKMGFVKKDQFVALEARVKKLESSRVTSAAPKRKAPIKKSATMSEKKVIKKKAQKKGSR